MNMIVQAAYTVKNTYSNTGKGPSKTGALGRLTAGVLLDHIPSDTIRESFKVWRNVEELKVRVLKDNVYKFVGLGKPTKWKTKDWISFAKTTLSITRAIFSLNKGIASVGGVNLCSKIDLFAKRCFFIVPRMDISDQLDFVLLAITLTEEAQKYASSDDEVKKTFLTQKAVQALAMMLMGTLPVWNKEGWTGNKAIAVKLGAIASQVWLDCSDPKDKLQVI